MLSILKKHSFALSICCLTFFSFFSLNAPGGNKSETEVKAEINKTISSAGLADSLWSISIKDENKQTLYEKNQFILVTPASNLKAITSAASLNQLGSDFTFKTHVHGHGKLEGNTWEGDLIFVGSGDPTINGDEYGGERFYVFKQFIEQLKKQGIEKVNGDVIFNDGLFDQPVYPKGWSWDDLAYYYAVPIGALSFNNNCVDLTVRANGAVGTRPELSWFPYNTDYITFINEQVISKRGYAFEENYQRDPATNSIILRSGLPQGYVEGESLAVREPCGFFADSFEKFTKENDFPVSGSFIVDHANRNFNEFPVLATHKSIPVKNILKDINKKSNNFYTEMLLQTAVANKYKIPSTFKLGSQLVKEFFKQIGVASSQIDIDDASGLSPNNLITTNAMTDFLIAMKKHKDFPTYRASLAGAGVDGSLAGRFSGTGLSQNLIGKTGYITGARSLSGYFTTKSGRPLTFSIITNHFTEKVPIVDRTQETILNLIYENY